jgi:pimeloyl-ACP methyl ester carboxylesterase
MRDTHVRFCRSFDGTRIAFAVSGRGPPVVLLPSWLTHLELQPRSVAWRPWIEALSARHTLVRYDPRGCGLSDRNVRNLSFDAWVLDLQAVVDGLGLDRFSLIGACQGGAVAIAWAGINAHRIDRLVLHGTYARGRDRRSDLPMEPEKARIMLEMIAVGWGTRTMPSRAPSRRSSSPRAGWITSKAGARSSGRRPRGPRRRGSPGSCTTST